MGTGANVTDRVRGAYVVFDHDIRTDDVEAVVNAIRMVRCVADVKTDQFVNNPNDYMARARVADEVLDITSFVLRASLTGEAGYCSDKPKVIAAMESILKQLRGK